MIPVHFVPVDIDEVIHVFEKDGEILILDEFGEDVTKAYAIKIVRKGNTETVVVRTKQ